MKKDIRWKQRLRNFEKTLDHLEKALNIPNPDIIQRAGCIHFFEMGLELAWNVMKDYLDSESYSEIKSPRSTVKKAFESGLISNGHLWLQALEDRNLTSHAYDDKTSKEIENKIRNDYFPLFKELYSKLRIKSE